MRFEGRKSKEKNTDFSDLFPDNQCFCCLWSHLGLNQGLPDYESGALTN